MFVDDLLVPVPQIFLKWWVFLKQVGVRTIVSVCLVLSGLVMSVVGFAMAVGLLEVPGSKGKEVIDQLEVPPLPSLGQVTVEVSGAVTKPGLYTLSSQDRVGQAIAAAGGFSEDADSIAVAKQLNLASRLEDELKINVPALTFGGRGSTSSSNSAMVAAPSSMSQEHDLSIADLKTAKISLNSASEAELDSLPGIGAKRAADILANRPYSKTSDLVSKKIVSQSVFAELEPLITL